MKESILILGHGSRDPLAVQEFLHFSEAFKSYGNLSNSVEMTTAFLELSEPDIPQALKTLAVKGVEKITVIPYFLFRAGHVKEEIPRMLVEFNQENPKIKIIYGESLWPHRNLTEVAKMRIQREFMKFPQNGGKRRDVLIVGRGARDPEALNQFEEAVKNLKYEIPNDTFHSCYIALAQPAYSFMLQKLLDEGVKDLVVFPYYLFTGILVKRIKDLALRMSYEFEGVHIRVAEHFGIEPLMFQMLDDRIKQIRSDYAFG